MHYVIAYIVVMCTYVGLFYWIIKLESINHNLKHSLTLQRGKNVLTERKYQRLLTTRVRGNNA